MEIAAWEHWCGATTPGDPNKTNNTVDGGQPAPVCSGCRFEIPLHKAGKGEVVLLYSKAGNVMNQKLVIIILCGVIFGMVMTVPQFFMSDIIAGGLIFGAIFAVIGWLVLRRKQKNA